MLAVRQGIYWSQALPGSDARFENFMKLVTVLFH